MANKNYTRVAPRDFFNEAKLLKCLGQLTLAMLDRKTPCKIGMIEDSGPFEIALMDDGHLTVINREFNIKNVIVIMKTTYNSKANYPLLVEHEYCEYTVFDEDGEFSEEFINFCKGL